MKAFSQIQHTIHTYVRSRQKGFTLFIAFLTASLLLAIGIAISNIAFKELVLSSGARDSQGAFYAADTALECALYWDIQHPYTKASIFGGFALDSSLSEGLLGHWRLDDGDGSVADDAVGTNNGSLTSIPTDAWTDGQVLGALTIGTNGYVDIGDETDFALVEEYTISAWINIENGASVDRRIVARRSDTDNTQVNYLLTVKRDAAGGTIDLRHREQSSGTNVTAEGVTSVVGAGWTHVAGVFDGSELRVYVDGIEEGRVDAGAPVKEGTQLLYIGDDPFDTAQGIDGSVDDIRIYDRALDQNEIRELASLPSGPWRDPILPDTASTTCLFANITDPSEDGSHWQTDIGANEQATTTFQLTFSDDRCASVEVAKNVSETRIVARGYSSCNIGNIRRVERAIRAQY